MPNCSAECSRICNFWHSFGKICKNVLASICINGMGKQKNRIRYRKAIFESVPKAMASRYTLSFIYLVFKCLSKLSDIVCLDLSESAHSFGKSSVTTTL